MQEIEIKILGIDRLPTEKRLAALGAVKVFDAEVHAIYLDSADRVVRKNGGTFRLRRQGGRAVLTYKIDVENTEAKIRDERELEVSDFGLMKEILESLGFSPWLEMKKHRTTYELEGLHFELDKYHGDYEFIPEFLEIEGTDIEAVYNYAGLLGFRREDCVPWDALQVAEYYRTGRGRK